VRETADDAGRDEGAFPNIREQLLQLCFALFKRVRTPVFAVQFEQIEPVQKHMVVVSVGVELLEIGDPIENNSSNRSPPKSRSAKSQAVALLQVGTRSRLPHHSATAKQ